MAGTGRDNYEEVAESIPFDNAINGFIATDVQTAIEELGTVISTSASPGFSYGRTGVCSAGIFMQNETVPSNISGRWVYINSAAVKKVFVSNELSTTYTIEAMYHNGNGTGLTSLGSVTVTAAYGGAFSVNWPVPTGRQIAIRIGTSTANSPKNIVCGLQLSGTL
jgi:hypothetical protein